MNRNRNKRGSYVLRNIGAGIIILFILSLVFLASKLLKASDDKVFMQTKYCFKNGKLIEYDRKTLNVALPDIRQLEHERVKTLTESGYSIEKTGMRKSLLNNVYYTIVKKDDCQCHLFIE